MSFCLLNHQPPRRSDILPYHNNHQRTAAFHIMKIPRTLCGETPGIIVFFVQRTYATHIHPAVPYIIIWHFSVCKTIENCSCERHANVYNSPSPNTLAYRDRLICCQQQQHNRRIQHRRAEFSRISTHKIQNMYSYK